MEKAEKPFDNYKVYKFWHKKQGRYYAFLTPIDKTLKDKCTSWARYLMSTHLGRFLDKNEQVDHINNIKSDDRIENLQILTPSQNIIKSSKGRTYVKTSCSFCHKDFQREIRQMHHKNHFCSKDCLYKWLSIVNRQGSVLGVCEIRHGSKVAYDYHKCRCDICKIGNRDRMRIYNLSKKNKKAP